MEVHMDNKDIKSVGFKIGQFLALVLAACLTLCIGGTAVILTIKFLSAFAAWMLF
jgi:hypothetical protein